jgi:hypothetical protein
VEGGGGARKDMEGGSRAIRLSRVLLKRKENFPVHMIKRKMNTNLNGFGCRYQQDVAGIKPLGPFWLD